MEEAQKQMWAAAAAAGLVPMQEGEHGDIHVKLERGRKYFKQRLHPTDQCGEWMMTTPGSLTGMVKAKSFQMILSMWSSRWIFKKRLNHQLCYGLEGIPFVLKCVNQVCPLAYSFFLHSYGKSWSCLSQTSVLHSLLSAWVCLQSCASRHSTRSCWGSFHGRDGTVVPPLSCHEQGRLVRLEQIISIFV